MGWLQSVQLRYEQIADFATATVVYRKVVDAINRLMAIDILSGQLLDKDPDTPRAQIGWITLTNGQVKYLRHSLGRALRGVIVVDLVLPSGTSAAGSIIRVIRNPNGVDANEKTDVWLKAIGFGADNPRVRLWVF